jgi:NTE family protein
MKSGWLRRGECCGAALLAAFALAVAAQARAQPATTPAAKPRICLVLSGGGARGAAHIGVLKVLEELRVPVHCITGTSMGSLVGGAYASGTSVAEMETMVGDITLELLFKEKPPRQDTAIRRKLDDRTNLVTPEIGVRDGALLLPKGLVSGVQLETVLRKLARAKGYRKFDELPIPYRAVATDLVTGKAVIFKEGELALVMRASMSVPGAVAPAEFDGHILVDGGLTNNLPVDAARAMGADVVIAVNLGSPLLKREELGSFLGATGQMINILTEQNVQASLASLKPTDILIEPELGDFSAADFDNLTKTIPIGEAAARKVAARLAALALPPQQYAALRASQHTPAALDTRAVDEIRFETMARVDPRVAAGILDTTAGQPLDQDMLDRDLRRLYGTGDFEHVSYRLLEEPGRRILSVDAVEKSWGPNYLRFGLGLSSDFKGDAFFNLLASYRKTWLNSLGAEWRTDLQIGRTSRIFTEFYQPLVVGRYLFVAPSAEIERRAVDIFQGNERIASYDVNTPRVALELGSQLTKYGEIRVGVAAARVTTRLDTGPPYLDVNPKTTKQVGPIVRAVVDQLDSANFPRSGYAGSIHISSPQSGMGSDSSYTKGEVDAVGYASFGDHTFGLGLRGAGPLAGALPRSDYSQWGGLLQQSGYRTGALIGETLAFGRLTYHYKLARVNLLEGVYAGFSLEAGRVGKPLVPGSPEGLLKSSSVFLGMDTPIGPLYVGYGRAGDGSSSSYLFLGRP